MSNLDFRYLYDAAERVVAADNAGDREEAERIIAQTDRRIRIESAAALTKEQGDGSD